MDAGDAGFADELTLLFPRGEHRIGISRWDGKEVEGTPEAQPYEASDSPFHEIAAHN